MKRGVPRVFAMALSYTLFDDRSRRGAFDYLIHIEDRPDFAIECKTLQGNSLVDLNSACEVLSATEIHGHADKFCVTLCNPDVNPDVLPDLAAASRLGIVETHEIAVALARVIGGKLSAQSFHDWSTQPGLIKADNLYVYSTENRAVSDIGVERDIALK